MTTKRPQPPEDPWTKWDKRVRDLAIFAIGASALVNEIFLKASPNLATLFFAGGMVGLPFALKADELRRRP